MLWMKGCCGLVAATRGWPLLAVGRLVACCGWPEEYCSWPRAGCCWMDMAAGGQEVTAAVRLLLLLAVVEDKANCRAVAFP